MEENQYRLIQLAGLLHDIGIFIHMGSFPGLDTTGRPSQISRDFIAAHRDIFARYVDIDLLQKLVGHTNEKVSRDEDQSSVNSDVLQSLGYIISWADRFSCAGCFDGNENDINARKTPLASVFARIQIEQDKPRPIPQFYQPHPLTPQAGFPDTRERVEASLQDQINNLLQLFASRFSILAQDSKPLDYPAFFAKLLALLQEFTWVIPSNTQEEISDISLFDHLKTTTAIATAMYLYQNDSNDLSSDNIRDQQENKFRLVVGDLSGIQSFIFSSLAHTSKGAAKTLRARSFILAMISELVSHRVLELFNLSPANILMASGGKFYILVPNTKDSVSRIMILQEEIDRLLNKRYRGEIGLNLSQVPFNGAAFQNFDQVLHQAGQMLNQKKTRPFQTILQKQNQWNEDSFMMELEGNPAHGICDGCGKAFAVTDSDEVDFCVNCLNEHELGKRFTRAAAIYFYQAPVHTHDKFQLLGEYWIALEPQPNVNSSDLPYLVIQCNDPNLLQIKQPGYFRFITNHVPTDPSGAPKDFDVLAAASTGRSLLGYLKCDVDNLGSIFYCGLYENETRNYNNIARLTTLSRMLDLFFAGFVNRLLVEKYPDCYAVFSGGDDLFLIGPWNRIIDLASEIQQEFSRFVNGNPNITLSTGICICKSRFPVSRAAELAEEYLEKAKETIVKGENSGRNQVYVFGRTIRWPDFGTLLEEAKWLAKHKVTDAFLYRLLDYENMFQWFYREGKINGLKYIPLLCYDLARNFKSKEDEIRNWAEELKDVNRKRTIYLRFILEYVINLTREAKSNGKLS